MIKLEERVKARKTQKAIEIDYEKEPFIRGEAFSLISIQQRLTANQTLPSIAAG